ncbi:CBS domain-containing protein [Agarilytica rhodophyticola]|uniref:CBS domain-containing protein n=1 Tax=Agarilytica rhodophyticola TaxID=1737490 RepID=UPI000B3451DA|nr:CBS domain-containing protein [Agarilytica rhodophyticola]
MHSILVKDYMDENPHAIMKDATVRDAVTVLMKEQISGAPVIDTQKNLVGFVSEQDCIQEMLNDAFYCEGSPDVTSVMSKDVQTVSPNTSIVEIAEQMAKRPPKNYPVCADGKLIGLISRRLILKALLENDDDCYIHT